MDAAITNVGSESVYIPGPEIEVAVGETKNWENITLSDLDANVSIKAAVVAGNLSISLTPDTTDAAVAAQGALNSAALEVYTVANLPTGYEGRLAFASDGRKVGEGAGVGTGVPVYFSNTMWRTFPADAVVTS